MPEITLLEPRTVDAIRLYVRGDLSHWMLQDRGVYQPIDFVAASGRARCRACGAKIPKGEECVAFDLDLYQARFGRWGHAVRAWIHTECPDQKGAADE